MVGSFVFFILHCVISGMNILVIYLYRTKIVHIITPFDISMIHLFPLLCLLLLHPPSSSSSSSSNIIPFIVQRRKNTVKLHRCEKNCKIAIRRKFANFCSDQLCEMLKNPMFAFVCKFFSFCTGSQTAQGNFL